MEASGNEIEELSQSASGRHVRWVDWARSQDAALQGRRGAEDSLFLNDGDGTSTDVSDAWGLRRAFGNGLGIVTEDLNGDGLIDVYVANDSMPNQLWLNTGDGRFQEDSLMQGCQVNQHGNSEAGMGVTATDLDQDGDLDLFLAHLRGETNTMYIKEGTMFNDLTDGLGLAAASVPFTGFGLGAGDWDNDGMLDLFVANGGVIRNLSRYGDDDYSEPNQIFMQDGKGKWRETMPRGGTEKPLYRISRGAGFGDLDNDGDIDIVVVNCNGPIHVLRNNSSQKRNGITFRVLGSNGLMVVGATLAISVGGKIQLRDSRRVSSYLASNDPRVHFGLDKAPSVDHVDVTWPDGSVERFGSFAAKKIHTIKKGTGKQTKGPRPASSASGAR